MQQGEQGQRVRPRGPTCSSCSAARSLKRAACSAAAPASLPHRCDMARLLAQLVDLSYSGLPGLFRVHGAALVAAFPLCKETTCWWDMHRCMLCGQHNQHPKGKIAPHSPDKAGTYRAAQHARKAQDTHREQREESSDCKRPVAAAGQRPQRKTPSERSCVQAGARPRPHTPQQPRHLGVYAKTRQHTLSLSTPSRTRATPSTIRPRGARPPAATRPAAPAACPPRCCRQEVPAHRATRRSPGYHVQGFGARCQANTVCQTVRHRAHVAAPRRAARLVGVRPPRRPERARSAAGACAPGLRAVAADGAREQVLRRQLERQRRPGLARAVAVRRTVRRTERRSERRAVAGRVQVEPVVVVVVWVMPCAQGGQPLVRALGP